MSRGGLGIKVVASFKNLLEERGWSEKAIKKLWTWYDYSDKKGVASF